MLDEDYKLGYNQAQIDYKTQRIIDADIDVYSENFEYVDFSDKFKEGYQDGFFDAINGENLLPDGV